MPFMSDASERFTFDTNVLVYAVDRGAGSRHEAAAVIIPRAAQLDCCLTLQAVSEFFVVVSRKGTMSRPDAAAQAEDWLRIFPCASASATAIRTALGDAVAGRASYWDALLVATAAEAGCTLILTEDLADDSSLGGVAIHNPFTRSGRLTPRARRLLGI
jgi:predicted nucleic acid-binding protein